jgi:hypothetical protein
VTFNENIHIETIGEQEISEAARTRCAERSSDFLKLWRRRHREIEHLIPPDATTSEPWPSRRVFFAGRRRRESRRATAT